MTFKILADDLHQTGELAIKYFKQTLGAKKIKVETAVECRVKLPLQPTFIGELNNGNILCVEVSNRVYSNTLDSFVVECSNAGLPVKLYIVVPHAKKDRDLAGNLKKAKSRGVGVVEIAADGADTTYSNALSLSLFGLRRFNVPSFPSAKREIISQAELTFLNGDPVKGCQSLFEELEAHTRAFAIRSENEGWWRQPHTGEKRLTKFLAKDPWAKVLHDLSTFLDFKKSRVKCPGVTSALIAKATGSTDLRNLTSHKPSTTKEVIDRDRKLRTWFETTGDVLQSWYAATTPLKLTK